MFVYFYYAVFYFWTVAFGIQIIYFTEPFFILFTTPNSIKVFFWMLVMSSLISLMASMILHFVYIWRYSSEFFLKHFYRSHFIATYISGAFSVIVAGEKTLTDWGFKDVAIESNKKITFLILLFVALSNNAFYKAFEESIVSLLKNCVSRIKILLKKI
ncbi:hypothetical protein P4324_27625 [Bacillus thuringiensis]|nr:hypothetical protein [Bacillus thuringiensis]MED2925781.1 hypothetical protein [Bacillus thuringiensis]MED3051058.1 hypothetical protein [Bacillus thuringiensis]